MIAFLTQVGETIGADARHLHLGMTSSDLVDTALALTLTRAADLLLAEVEPSASGRGPWRSSTATRRWWGAPTASTPSRSRSDSSPRLVRGAGPRDHAGFAPRAPRVAVGKLSGAVGHVGAPEPGARRARDVASLGLSPEPAATQVVQRDRHAELLSALALLGASLEKIALEIRHLQRTEVREVEEPFRDGQKGSSVDAAQAEPGPLRADLRASRACCGRTRRPGSRTWRSGTSGTSATRRSSGSSFPDSFLLADFMTSQTNEVLTGLRVYPERMRANLERTRGLVYSQRVLLALTAAGLAREEAYAIVQEHAMTAWKAEPDLTTRLAGDPAVTQGLEALGAGRPASTPGYFTRNVSQIFDRVLGASVAASR